MKYDVKKAIEILLSSKGEYYDEAIYKLETYFPDIEVAEVYDEVTSQRRWETDTMHVYSVLNKGSSITNYIAIINTMGNTESQENEGITDAYEVERVPVQTYKYVVKE